MLFRSLSPLYTPFYRYTWTTFSDVDRRCNLSIHHIFFSIIASWRLPWVFRLLAWHANSCSPVRGTKKKRRIPPNHACSDRLGLSNVMKIQCARAHTPGGGAVRYGKHVDQPLFVFFFFFHSFFPRSSKNQKTAVPGIIGGVRSRAPSSGATMRGFAGLRTSQKRVEDSHRCLVPGRRGQTC